MLRFALLLIVAFLTTMAFGEDAPPNKNTDVETTEPDDGTEQTPEAVSPRKNIVNLPPAEVKIREAMQTRITGEFKEVPLNEILKALAARGKLSIWLDVNALEAEATDATEPVTNQFHKVTIESALNQILEPLNLSWFVEEGTVHVTTSYEESETFFIRTYDLQTILAHEKNAVTRSGNQLLDFHAPGSGNRPVGSLRTQFGAGGGGGLGSGGFGGQSIPVISHQDLPEEWSSLIEDLQSLTGGPWMDMDGEGGKLIILDKTLIVKASYQLHREVEGFFSAVQSMQVAKQNATPLIGQRNSYPSELDAVVERALEREWNAVFKKHPLHAVLAEVSQAFSISVKINETALAEFGIRTSEPVTVTLKDQSLRSVLNSILKPLDLVAVVREGSLQITPTDLASEDHFLKLYDLRHFPTLHDGDELTEAIMQATDSWLDIDGLGGNLALSPSGILLVRQSYLGHRQVGQLISNLQKSLSVKPAATSQSLDPNKVTLQYYNFDNTVSAGEMAKSIQEFIAPKSWKANGGNSIIKQVGMTLLIQQPVKTHKLLHDWLNDYYKRTASPPTSSPFGGGSFSGTGPGRKGTSANGGNFFQLPPNNEK